MKKIRFILIIILSVISVTTQAQSEEEISGDDLAKKAQNPIANMISVPIQNNTSYGIGSDGIDGNQGLYFGVMEAF